METNKHWKGDTLNSSGSKVVQFRNDNQLFSIKSGNTEIILDKFEANFLLLSLKRVLKPEKTCCSNHTPIYNHNKTKSVCFHCGKPSFLGGPE